MTAVPDAAVVGPRWCAPPTRSTRGRPGSSTLYGRGSRSPCSPTRSAARSGPTTWPSQLWDLVALPPCADRAGPWHLVGPDALSRHALGVILAEAHGLDPAGITGRPEPGPSRSPAPGPEPDRRNGPRSCPPGPVPGDPLALSVRRPKSRADKYGSGAMKISTQLRVRRPARRGGRAGRGPRDGRASTSSGWPRPTASTRSASWATWPPPPRRIQIGSGILPIYTRTPTLIAMTAAGLDAVSDGRCILGLGASGPQVIEGFHGVPYDRRRSAAPARSSTSAARSGSASGSSYDGQVLHAAAAARAGHRPGQAAQVHHPPGARLDPDLRRRRSAPRTSR